jgi:hypothetical protein
MQLNADNEVTKLVEIFAATLSLRERVQAERRDSGLAPRCLSDRDFLMKFDMFPWILDARIDQDGIFR